MKKRKLLPGMAVVMMMCVATPLTVRGEPVDMREIRGGMQGGPGCIPGEWPDASGRTQDDPAGGLGEIQSEWPGDGRGDRWELRFRDAETGETLLDEGGEGKPGGAILLSEEVPRPSDQTGGLKPSGELSWYLKKARELESQMTGEAPDSIPDARFLITNQSEDYLRIQSIAGYLGGKNSQMFIMIGKNYIPGGTGVAVCPVGAVAYSGSVEETLTVGEETYTVVKLFAEVKKDGDVQIFSREKRHWNPGDMVERELGGVTYRFRCIDQNYSDRLENHRPSALFLCDRVIPADFKSAFRYEEQADGTFDYVFYPGPLVNFGSGSDYKDSAVRRWLSDCADGLPEAEVIHTGVDLAYTGSTGSGMYGQLDAGELAGTHIGYQEMTDRLFILSVDSKV